MGQVDGLDDVARGRELGAVPAGRTHVADRIVGEGERFDRHPKRIGRHAAVAVDIVEGLGGVVAGRQTFKTHLNGRSGNGDPRPPDRLTAVVSFFLLSGQYTSDWGEIMAAALIIVLPVIVLLIALQRRFIEGMAGGSVKG